MGTRIRRTTAADGPGLPYALDYYDTDRKAWRLWDRFNGTLGAAWEAHTVFGAPKPEGE
jgi:hypothetical protein